MADRARKHVRSDDELRSAENQRKQGDVQGGDADRDARRCRKLKSTTWSRTRESGARSQRPCTAMIATTVTASAARDVTVSRHQLSALERRQMSEVTTP